MADILVTIPRDYSGRICLDVTALDSPAPVLRDSPPDDPVDLPTEDETYEPVEEGVTNTSFRGVPLSYCGMDTEYETLEALYELACTAYDGQRLQAAVLNEWTGEASIAIAMACMDHSRVPVANCDVYAVANFSDNRSRSKSQIEVMGRIPSLLERNLASAHTGGIAHVDLHPYDAVKDSPVLDLVYVNGFAEVADAYGLLHAYYPLVAKGGVICGAIPAEARKQFGKGWQRSGESKVWYLVKQ